MDVNKGIAWRVPVTSFDDIIYDSLRIISEQFNGCSSYDDGLYSLQFLLKYHFKGTLYEFYDDVDIKFDPHENIIYILRGNDSFAINSSYLKKVD